MLSLFNSQPYFGLHYPSSHDNIITLSRTFSYPIFSPSLSRDLSKYIKYFSYDGKRIEGEREQEKERKNWKKKDLNKILSPFFLIENF